MFIDANMIFDNNGDLTSATYGSGAAGTYPSANSYDTAVAGTPAAVGPAGGTIGGPLLHDVGRGKPLLLLCKIGTAVTSAGAATLEVDFISSASANLGSATVILQSPAVAKATLVANYRYPYKTLPGKVTQRFIGVQMVIGTATITAGTITNAMVMYVDDHADLLGGAP